MTFQNSLNYDALQQMANALRFLSIDAVEKANSGHPGMPMGMADIATILFSKFLKFNPQDPNWLNRDRFILSNGHGSALLYSLLYLTGYDLSLDELKNFRQLNSKTPGHPEFGHTFGVETTTGPLGQGIANAVGMAIAAKNMQAKFNQDLFNHKIYCFTGDGCLMEGLSHEVCSLAGHLKLNNLILIFDDNKICIDGSTDTSCSENHQLRFEAYGWKYIKANGHDFNDIETALSDAQNCDQPVIIAARTTIAFGSPHKANSEKAHGSPLGKDEVIATRKQLNWPYAEFEIPAEILTNWRSLAKNNQQDYENWLKQFNSFEENKKNELTRIFAGKLPEQALNKAFDELKQEFITQKPNYATRKSSGIVIEKITPILPELMGGSADLSESNQTKTKHHQVITAQNFAGNYLYYGVREHGMASVMNGLRIYGSVIPYGGTFLAFADYLRPGLRLSALMQQKVIYVLTHDSIGLGEDGPTHQPVEHLASLRAIPNLLTLRPADSIETIEAWEIALNHNGPSVLALSRQNLPTLREAATDNLSQRGAYILKDCADPQVTIFATGSELSIAYEAYQELTNQNIKVRLVSVPSMELFEQQSQEYFTNIVCNKSIKVAVEAGVNQGWHKIIGPHGIFIGMNSFGASGKAADLYEYFGITKYQIIKKVLERLNTK